MKKHVTYLAMSAILLGAAAMPSVGQTNSCRDTSVVQCFDSCNDPLAFQECIIGCALGGSNDLRQCDAQCFGDPTCLTKCRSAVAAVSSCLSGSFRVSYFPNLNVGDSVINITNPGTLGAGLAAGVSASTTGAICVNAYAFSPDEQMISCCSCPVTPNGLVSLSVRNDLISNTLTPAVPTSIVVKLVATVPAGGTCTGSAAAVSSLDLANSISAWGTKVHPINGASSPMHVTETEFLQGTLSTGELNRLGNLCTFINATGSGFGICRSCRLGGLGAGRQ